jgi:hypothetical protein
MRINLSTDIVEHLLGVVDENLLATFGHNPVRYPVVIIATNRRIIVKGLEWYKKWLNNNGGVLLDGMLDDLGRRRFGIGYQVHAQISRKDISKTKLIPRRKLLFRKKYLDPELAFSTKSRFSTFSAMLIHITDDSAIDKLTNIGLISG